jgi:undecaprenyl-diphosphatase
MHATETQPHHLLHLTGPGLIGMACSFVAGLLALRILSRWLENGRWHYFGYYCLAAAVGVMVLAAAGY